MDIFLSWSGERSHAVALAFHGWLQDVLQAARPFLSTIDVSKGSAWADDLQKQLTTSNGVGIFFVTEEALSSNWLLYEAGRIASLGKPHICVVRIGVDRVDAPLGMYQSTALTRGELSALIKTLNGQLPFPLPETVWSKAFERAWPDFEKQLQAAVEVGAPTPVQPPAPETSASELLSQVLSAFGRVEARLGNVEDRIVAIERAPRSLHLDAEAGTIALVGQQAHFRAGPAPGVSPNFFGPRGPRPTLTNPIPESTPPAPSVDLPPDKGAG